MKKQTAVNSYLFVQLSAAAFFVLLGLVGIVSYNSDLNRLGRTVNELFGGKNDPVDLVIAILSLASGVIVLGALVDVASSRARYFALLGVAAFWVLRIVYVFLVQNAAFEPDALVWLQQLSVALVVLASVWLVARKYA